MELEAVIKERIQERFDILQELYTIWFTENPACIVPKKRFYPDAHIEFDFFEQGRLDGRGNGWSVVTEHLDE